MLFIFIIIFALVISSCGNDKSSKKFIKSTSSTNNKIMSSVSSVSSSKIQEQSSSNTQSNNVLPDPVNDIIGAWINTDGQLFLFGHYVDNSNGHYLCDFMLGSSMFMSLNCLLEPISDTIIKFTILAEDRNYHTESKFVFIFNFKDKDNIELSYQGSTSIIKLKRTDTKLAGAMLNL